MSAPNGGPTGGPKSGPNRASGGASGRPPAASFAPPAESLGRLERRAATVGALGAAASVVGLFVAPGQLHRSLLVSWLFWLGLTLGCIALMMLHHLSRGAWGVMTRRVMEAASRTLPLLVLLFVPIALGLEHLYPWARPAEVANDPLIQAKTWWLNPGGFHLRALLYFAIWGGFAWWVNGLSAAQDETGDDRLFRRMQLVSAPGLGLYCLAVTFASVDWLMSLDPHWYSSLFGVYFLGGHAVSGFAFVVVAALWLSRREPLAGHLQPRHFHDLGKLLLAFVSLWAYFAFSQFLIIWSGNLQEEVVWYQARQQGVFRWLSLGLILFHFALPFVLLLSRDLKRNARRLAAVAVLLLVMRWVDLYWQAAPAFGHGVVPHWLDLATLAGVGGLWVAVFARQLGRRSLLPIHEPFLEEALADEHH